MACPLTLNALGRPGTKDPSVVRYRLTSSVTVELSIATVPRMSPHGLNPHLAGPVKVLERAVVLVRRFTKSISAALWLVTKLYINIVSSESGPNPQPATG